jgi:hypothetical protein
MPSSELQYGSAAAERSATGDLALAQNLSQELNQDVKFALDHTFLIQSQNAGVGAFPRSPWNCETLISHVGGNKPR